MVMMGLEERVHGKVVGTSRCGPASDLRHWEPEPGHPAAENIIGWGGGGSGEGWGIEMPDPMDHFIPPFPKP